MSHSLSPHGLYPSRLLCPWNSLGQNTGVGSPSLLQRIFPTQVSRIADGFFNLPILKSFSMQNTDKMSSLNCEAQITGKDDQFLKYMYLVKKISTYFFFSWCRLCFHLNVEYSHSLIFRRKKKLSLKVLFSASMQKEVR